MTRVRVVRIYYGLLTLCYGLALVTLSMPAAACHLSKYAELPVTMSGTAPLVRGPINGMSAVFVADSGAFFSMLTTSSAEKFKLRASGLTKIEGIGGSSYAGIVLVKAFSLNGFGTEAIPRVQFLVSGNYAFSSIDGLIGQNVLGGDVSEYDLGNGFIRLYHAKDCNGNVSLAYWHGTADVSIIPIKYLSNGHIVGEVSLNGSQIRVLFDSGTSHSVLTLKAAARAGIETATPGVVKAGSVGGVGPRRIDTWIARFDNLDLGGEMIKNPRLRIGDIELMDGDLLLGADFFLSHHIIFSKNQGKAYFTYNGGHVFDLTVIPDTETASTPDSTVPAVAPNTLSSAETPADAAGFRRRGVAFAGRGDLPDAIADLDQAIRLDPTDAENFYQRAMVHLLDGKKDLTVADLDQALKLKPDYVDALMQRASLRFANHDDAGARADYEAAINAAPTDAGLELAIARIYSNAGQYDGAIPFLDRWINSYSNDPRRANALNSRCWVRAMLNQRLDLAMADCNASLKLRFEPATLDSRALVWLRMGELTHSIADYKFALYRRPTSAASLYGKGLAELRQGNKAEGEKDINAAVAIAPNIADEFKQVGLTP